MLYDTAEQCKPSVGLAMFEFFVIILRRARANYYLKLLILKQYGISQSRRAVQQPKMALVVLATTSLRPD